MVSGKYKGFTDQSKLEKSKSQATLKTNDGRKFSESSNDSSNNSRNNSYKKQSSTNQNSTNKKFANKNYSISSGLNNYGNQNGSNIILKRNLSGFGRGKFVTNQQSDQGFNNSVGRNRPPPFLATAKPTNSSQPQTQDLNNNDKKETNNKIVFY